MRSERAIWCHWLACHIWWRSPRPALDSWWKAGGTLEGRQVLLPISPLYSLPQLTKKSAVSAFPVTFKHRQVVKNDTGLRVFLSRLVYWEWSVYNWLLYVHGYTETEGRGKRHWFESITDTRPVQYKRNFMELIVPSLTFSGIDVRHKRGWYSNRIFSAKNYTNLFN